MTNVDPAAFGRLLAGIDRAYAQGDPEFAKKAVEAANVDTLRRLMTCLLEGRLADLQALLTEDIAFEVSGLPEWNGRSLGRDAVIDAIKRNFASVAEQQPVVRSLVAQGDEIALFLEERGLMRSSGQRYHMNAVQWFTLKDGKVARIREVVGSP